MNLHSSLQALVALVAAMAPLALHGAEGRSPSPWDSLGLHLRWDEVEGSPYHVGGVEPAWDWELGHHAFELEPGDFIALKLPPGSLLRAKAHVDSLRPGDLEAWISDGSGVLLPVDLTATSRADTRVVFANSPHAVLVRLERPRGAKESFLLSLFVSRRDLEAPAEHLGTLLDFPGEEHWLRTEEVPGRFVECVTFWSTRGHERSELEVEGPGRLLFLTRLLYPEGEACSAQAYSLRVRVGRRTLDLQFETSVDPDEGFLLGMRRVTLGAERLAYADLPRGLTTLSVEAPPDVLWRVLLGSPDDFLLETPPLGRVAPVLSLGFETLTCGPVIECDPTRDADFDRGYRWRSLLEPRSAGVFQGMRARARLDRGLEGALLLREAASGVSVHAADRTHAMSAARRHSFFRSILPRERAPGDLQVPARFAVRRLLGPLEAPRDERLLAEQVDDALSGASLAHFTRVPESRDLALVHELPRRWADGTGRLIVLHPSPGAPEVLIQCDDDPPVRARVLPDLERPPDEYQPSRVEAALAALRSIGDDPGLGRGPPRLDVGSAEFPVARAVRDVRIWADGPGVPPLVAFQLLVEAPVEWTEREYLSLLDSSPRARDILESFRAWQSEDPANPREVGDELLAGRLPFFRLLERSRIRFGEGLDLAAIRERRTPGRDPAQGPADRSAEASAALARAAAEAEDWLGCLEAWSRALVALDADPSGIASPLHREGILGRIGALEMLGEENLLEAQLRALIVDPRTASLRPWALDRLLRRRDAEDFDASSALVLGAAASTHDPELLRCSVAALSRSGEDRAAVDLGACVSGDELTREAMLVSTWRLRWWTLFEKQRALLGDEGRRSTWDGMGLWARGRREEALRRFEAGGGPVWDWVRDAIETSRSLRSPRLADRVAAIPDWESLSARWPGGRSWRDASPLVVDHQGGVACVGFARNTTESFFRARPSGAVRLRVQGPTELRFEFRPIHPADSRTPISGWIHVRSGTLLTPIAVVGNLRAAGVEVAGGDGSAVGNKVSESVSFAAGYHEIDVSSPGLDFLVRVLRSVPDCDLAILPELDPATLDRVLRGSPSPVSRESGARLLYFPEGRDGPCDSLGIHLLDGRSLAHAIEGLPEDIDPVLRARIALRRAAQGSATTEAPELERLLAAEGLVPPLERLLARERLRSAGLEPRESPDLLDELPDPVWQSVCLGEGRFRELIERAPSRDPDGARRRLAACLFIAERDPDLAMAARVAGERIFRKDTSALGLRPLLTAILAPSAWERVGTVVESAGLRMSSELGGMPEDPELRVRAALLPPLAAGERFLAGKSRLGLFLSLSRPTRVRVVLGLEAVPPRVPMPSTLRIELDGTVVSEPVLGPARLGAEEVVDVPAGEHAVRVSMLDPVVNQYVRVRFSELREGAGASLEAIEEESSEVRRTYLVATVDRPVLVDVEGPTWLRVDELRGSESLVSYREVPPGWNRLEFRPAAEQDEGLFRIFARGPRAADPQEPVPDADPGPRIAAPEPSGPSRSPPERLRLVDAFECEDNEDGSFALGISLNRKKMFDEDETQDFDEYVQIDATHRYLVDRENAHFETRALWRMHADAGPTVGFEEDIHYRPTWLPATLRLSGTAYVQWPDAPAVLPQNHPEWAGTLRGSLSRVFSLGFGAWHLPGVAVFGRYVSLDDAARYPTKTLDPDVYSQYKRDHSNGVVFSETVGYRPWFDAEAWAKASLTSNEDFDLGPPDQVALSAGWKQFWAGFEANLGYRATYFFADRDREDSILRNGPFVVLGYDLWTGPRDRLEFTIDYLHEFPNNADIGFVGVTWHFSGGRAYRDYWPGEVDFRSLKEERYHRRWENALAESGSE